MKISNVFDRMSEVNSKGYIVQDRDLENYKWYKPLLTGAVMAAIFFFITIILTVVLSVGIIMSGTDTKNLLPTTASIYDHFDVYSAYGALISLGNIAILIPALFLANKITKYKPSGNYTSVPGKWRMKWFLLSMLAAVLVVGIPNILIVIKQSNYTGTISFTAAGLILCLILGPLQCIAEEYVFRGFFMQAIGGWVKLSFVAIVLQAIPFMLLHPYNIWGKLEVLISGILFGLCCYLTDGIESSCALHIANNMSLFIMNGIGYESIKSQVDISGPISVIVLYGLYIAAIVFIKKKNLQDSDKKPQAELKEVV